uniref:NADH-ubiquinone oxidoreductase chain 6 n=1 Tax=Thoracotermes macrothorax TaxID=377994 RepID=A0A1S5VWU9_9NEOP|nr:NADH dehydrogenase subunit 6 [Thoracotermes macrothorax]AQP30491.1 NADH dehydrogenase subunit 6 [Thoracotermes macrothorax]
MNLLMSMSTLTSMMFTQMKHPMAMGMLLLIQTMMVCLISGTMYKSFWFSYILFMIMIGGMLVLFMYMTSLASNEMFSPSNKMLMMLVTLPILTLFMPNMMNNKEMNMYEAMMENEITTTTTVMYSQTMGIMTMLLVMYMLMTLIVVVNIINVSKGPLRQTS